MHAYRHIYVRLGTVSKPTVKLFITVTEEVAHKWRLRKVVA